MKLKKHINETEDEEDCRIIGSSGTRGSQTSSQARRRSEHKNRRDTTRSKPCPLSAKGRFQRSTSSDSGRDGNRSGSKDRSRSVRRSTNKRQEDPPSPQADTDFLVESEYETDQADDPRMDGSEPRSTRLSPDRIEATREILADTETQVAELLGREDCPSIAMGHKEGGQGRHPETGDYYFKRLQEARKQIVKAAQELRALRDESVPADLSNGRKIAVLRAREELSHTPTETLPGIILEAVGAVDKVAQKSGKLKGDFKGLLNKSAATIQVALSQLIQRYEGGESGLERDAEMERLREKISTQEKEIEALRNLQAQYNALQSDMREQQGRMELLQSQMGGNAEGGMRQTRERGAKRRRCNLPLLSSSSSSGDDERVLPTPTDDDNPRAPEEIEEIPPLTAMEVEEETKSSRNQVLEQIAKEGMPAAVRPAIKGRTKTMDPEVPAQESASKGIEGPITEERLAAIILRCVTDNVEERMGAMENRLSKQLERLAPREPATIAPSSKEASARKKREDAGPAAKTGAGRASSQRRKAKNERGREPPPNSRPQPPVNAPAPTHPPATTMDAPWSKVVGRKERKGGAEKVKPPPPSTNRTAGKAAGISTKAAREATPPQKGKKARRRVPKTSAVTLTCPEKEYGEWMGHVRREIKLEDLG